MKILIGYDGTNYAKKALTLAEKHARAFCASVTVVTSMKDGKDSEQEKIFAAETQLKWVKSLFDEKGIACDTHLLIHGNSPGEDIVEFAEEIQADEIVVGVKQRSKVGKLLMGSTAEYVILHAPCPVVSVK